MGTVPTPVLPGSGTAAASSQPTSWCNVMNFLLQPPSCRVRMTTSTAFASGTNPILWNAEDWDIVQSGDSPMHDTSTNTDKMYIRTPGRYRVQAIVSLSAAAAIFAVNIALYKNATQYDTNWLGVATNTPYTAVIADEVQCATGDYLTIQVNTTAALDIRGDIQCSFVATWVSN